MDNVHTEFLSDPERVRVVTQELLQVMAKFRLLRMWHRLNPPHPMVNRLAMHLQFALRSKLLQASVR